MKRKEFFFRILNNFFFEKYFEEFFVVFVGFDFIVLVGGIVVIYGIKYVFVLWCFMIIVRR